MARPTFAVNELKPVPVTYVGSEDRLKAQFDKHASEAMKLLLEDVTAHRYFEGVHLEPALKELGLAGLGPGPSPTLIEAELSGGGADDSDEVTLSLIFYSPECPTSSGRPWTEKVRRTRSSACNAEVEKISQPEKSSPCACPCSSGADAGGGRAHRAPATAAVEASTPSRDRRARVFRRARVDR